MLRSEKSLRTEHSPVIVLDKVTLGFWLIGCPHEVPGDAINLVSKAEQQLLMVLMRHSSARFRLGPHAKGLHGQSETLALLKLGCDPKSDAQPQSRSSLKEATLIIRNLA